MIGSEHTDGGLGQVVVPEREDEVLHAAAVIPPATVEQRASGSQVPREKRFERALDERNVLRRSARLDVGDPKDRRGYDRGAARVLRCVRRIGDPQVVGGNDVAVANHLFDVVTQRGVEVVESLAATAGCEY